MRLAYILGRNGSFGGTVCTYTKLNDWMYIGGDYIAIGRM